MPRISPPVQKISQRLHVTQDLRLGGAVTLDDKKAHYLRNVLRLELGAQIFLFNGRDGEWRGRIATLDKKRLVIEPEEQTRPQETPADIWLLVAPVKKDRLDYLAQKATEMGVGKLWPIVTARTQGGQLKHYSQRAGNCRAHADARCVGRLAARPRADFLRRGGASRRGAGRA